jgi:hypothetical protein
MSQSGDDADYSAAIEANDDLVERLRHGDVWALPSLLEAVTGTRIASMRILERQMG